MGVQVMTNGQNKNIHSNNTGKQRETKKSVFVHLL